jgi:hypothetical protein
MFAHTLIIKFTKADALAASPDESRSGWSSLTPTHSSSRDSFLIPARKLPDAAQAQAQAGSGHATRKKARSELKNNAELYVRKNPTSTIVLLLLCCVSLAASSPRMCAKRCLK